MRAHGGSWALPKGKLGNEGLSSLALTEQAVLLGNRKDAEFYLRRAEEHIDANDPEWLRLQDLSRAVEDIEEPPPRRRG